MRRAAVVVTVVTIAASLALPALRATIATGAGLVLLLVVAGHTVSWSASLRAPRPTMFERARAPHRELPARPPDLERLERLLGWRSYSSRDFNHRVRPLLLQLIAFKLKASHGIDPDVQPEAAARRLPVELRGLIGTQDHSDDSGVTDTAEIDALVSCIEAL
jgi:hypothetical protein